MGRLGRTPRRSTADAPEPPSHEREKCVCRGTPSSKSMGHHEAHLGTEAVFLFSDPPSMGHRVHCMPPDHAKYPMSRLPGTGVERLLTRAPKLKSKAPDDRRRHKNTQSAVDRG